jgi:hypothetical protein
MRHAVVVATHKGETMKHTERDYIEAGYQYERGRIVAQTLRAMIESEHRDDRTEARRLIEQGRTEAQQVSRK